MSDENPLSPDDDARVRALLADLGSEDLRMPDDVSARLEETLAGLVSERTPSPVVPLRRRVPRAAVAAAAVIVLGTGGVAAATFLHRPHGSSESTASAGSSVTTQNEARGATPSASDAQKSASGSAGGTAARVPSVSSRTFSKDVHGLVDSRLATRRPAAVPGATPAPDFAATCPVPSAGGGGRVLAITYDGQQAYLVLHPAGGGRTRVEAVGCDGARLASTTVAR